jgi:hypothetical protein
MTTQLSTQDGDLRRIAVDRLRKKRGLQAHLLAYVTVNLLLAAIWLATSPGGFYWPIIPLFGWGIGVSFHIWDVYSPAVFTEDRIEAEMRRIDRHAKRSWR